MLKTMLKIIYILNTKYTLRDILAANKARAYTALKHTFIVLFLNIFL